MFSTGRFMLSLALLFVYVLFSPFSIVITLLGEERVAFVCLFCNCSFLSFISSSWCQGLTAAGSRGTPWTFLLTFF